MLDLFSELNFLLVVHLLSLCKQLVFLLVLFGLLNGDDQRFAERSEHSEKVFILLGGALPFLGGHVFFAFHFVITFAQFYGYYRFFDQLVLLHLHKCYEPDRTYFKFLVELGNLLFISLFLLIDADALCLHGVLVALFGGLEALD